MKKTLFLLLLSIVSYAQIDRVEPPFWWEGMHHASVQIMFYGKDIASHTVTVSGDIPITAIEKTSNPNYLFVTLNTAGVQAQELLFTFKKGKKTFTESYALLSRKEHSKNRKGFDASDVVYLLMPDRFANGDPSNDNHPSVIEKMNRNTIDGRYGGDIAGIIKNLDYLEDLGVTALWSTPLCEDNDERGSYHTYGQSDLYKIDPRFGSNGDYLQLSNQLHQRGMKLIKDYVTNHWSYNHWMLHDLPSKNWFHPYKQTSYKTTVQMDPNVAEADKRHALDGWFVKSMPDLNQSNPTVANYLIQNAIWWIEYADLDGLRVDTYPYADKTFMATWTKAIMDEYPNFNITAEAWLYSYSQIAYWQKDSKIAAIQEYNSYCPNVMDFMWFQLFEKGILHETKQTWDGGMIKLYNHFTHDFLYPNINNVLIFLENHDTQRFNFVYPDIKDYQIGLGMLATTRGVPQIYYGTEIGMTGSKAVGDGDIRREFPGGWADHPQNAFTKAGRTPLQQEYFGFTQKLLQWRKHKTVIHQGKTMHYLPEENVYVYFRYNDDDSVMVIVNNSERDQKIAMNRFDERLENFHQGKDVLYEKIYDVKQPLTIKEKSIIILELQ